MSQERGAAAAYALLARLLGVIQERHHSELEDGEAVWVFVSGEAPRPPACVTSGYLAWNSDPPRRCKRIVDIRGRIVGKAFGATSLNVLA